MCNPLTGSKKTVQVARGKLKDVIRVSADCDILIVKLWWMCTTLIIARVEKKKKKKNSVRDEDGMDQKICVTTRSQQAAKETPQRLMVNFKKE
jgi:hypothetical protein